MSVPAVLALADGWLGPSVASLLLPFFFCMMAHGMLMPCIYAGVAAGLPERAGLAIALLAWLPRLNMRRVGCDLPTPAGGWPDKCLTRGRPGVCRAGMVAQKPRSVEQGRSLTSSTESM